MTSSETSTERGRSGRDIGIQPWHFYMLLALGGATWAVVVSRNTHPAALVLISAASIAAGLVGLALHTAIAGFLGDPTMAARATRSEQVRETLERDKALVLRSIKELEFDRAMKKVSDADFAEIGGRLRARAIALMEELDRTEGRRPAPAVPADPLVPRAPEVRAARAATADTCPSCGTPRDTNARFCKECGAKLT